MGQGVVVPDSSREKIQVGAAQGIRCENVLTGIATLRNVMGQTDDHDSRFPRHTELVLS